MRRSLIAAAALSALVVAPAVVLAQDASTPALAPTTLRVLVHQNPPFTAFMEKFNEQFEAAHPGVDVDMSVVAPNDLATTTQTRLAANDVDVVDIFAFSNGRPAVHEGRDAAHLADARRRRASCWTSPTSRSSPTTTRRRPPTPAPTTARSTQINLGRVGLQRPVRQQGPVRGTGCRRAHHLERAGRRLRRPSRPPTCPCMTAGGQDGWPIFVTGYGILGCAFPDQRGLVQGLWDGTIKYNDARPTSRCGSSCASSRRT